MAEIAVAPGLPDEVRTIQRRRGCEETAVRLALQFAERGTAWVARDDAEVVGVALAHDSDGERYLGDLYVEPSYRGRGVAADLLAAALLDAGDAARAMLVDPGEAASLALAPRHGMTLREPIVRFAGVIPREEELAKMAAGDYRFAVESVDPEAHAFGLRALDRQTRGIARDGDHADFARTAAGRAFTLSGEFVAYAYVWPDGRIGPLACASASYLVQIFSYTLLTLTREYGASWCTLLVPGSNLRIARAALRGGLRIHDSSVLAGDAFSGDMSTYVGCHSLLL